MPAMRSLLALLLAALPAFAQDIIAKTDPKTPADELKSFKVPAGFEVQLVASEPDIEKPIQIAFDSAGRLWVTTTRHYPFPAEKGKGKDKLFILSDFDANGKAKTIETFYAGLNIPIGILPLPDGKSCLVSEVGRILKLTDTKGAGKADLVEELFTGFGTEDTHGMTNSFLYMPDGWVYATHGFKNTSKVKAKDGSQIEMNSGNTYRFKPDGSRIEIVTRGQVNPFGLCCDPYLNLYTADCHSKPITQLIRGATYQSFGKPHDGLGFAPHVTNHSHGSTALCGLEWYSDTKYPKEYRDCLFLGNVVTNRINADRITFKGSTPVAEELPDFLTSSDPWFRPTDIKLGMDGALYFADFYNRIIGHYEVKLDHPQRDKDRGRIWRIVYKGKDGTRVKPGEPGASATGVVDLKKAKLTELWDALRGPNLTTKLFAFHEITHRHQTDSTLELRSPDGFEIGNIETLAEDQSMAWGMVVLLFERIKPHGVDEYKQWLERNKALPHESMRKESGLALRAFSSKENWTDEERKFAVQALVGMPNSPWIHRAAIDGITLHPHADFIPSLLKFIPTIPAEDTHLKFAARVALRECLELDEHRKGWAGLDNVHIAVIVDAGLGCKSKNVMEGLVFLKSKNHISSEFLPELFLRVGRYGTGQMRADLMADWNKDHASYAKYCLNMVKGMQAAGWKKEDEHAQAVVSKLTEMVSDAMKYPQPPDKSRSIKEGVTDARNLFLELRKLCDPKDVMHTYGNFQESMRSIAVSTAYDIEQRIAAFEVLLVSGFSGSRAELQPLTASEALDAESRERLLILLLQNKPSVSEVALAKDAIKTAKYSSAVQLATGLAGDPFGADLLLLAVKNGDAPARLLQEKAVLDKLKATKVDNLDAKVKELTAGIPSAEKRIDELIKKRAAAFPKAKADAAKGKAVFARNCGACHTLENVGAKVGPQLDGVGVRGLERLLEDTLDPNRNVDAAFRATKFDTLDGKTIVGLLLREEGAVYVVSDPQGKEVRLPKADVDKKTVIQQSAMPSNVDTLVPEKDYYDLLAYLLQQKPK
jgi:putative heme-binding domain-containing protein